jgi:hypothetical protein
MKGTIKTIEQNMNGDQPFKDKHGNLYYTIYFEELQHRCILGARKELALKAGDTIFYEAEERKDKNEKVYYRIKIAKDADQIDKMSYLHALTGAVMLFYNDAGEKEKIALNADKLKEKAFGIYENPVEATFNHCVELCYLSKVAARKCSKDNRDEEMAKIKDFLGKIFKDKYK